MRHGQWHPAPAAQQPAAIRRDRRCDVRRARNHPPQGPGLRSAKLGRKPPRFPL